MKVSVEITGVEEAQARLAALRTVTEEEVRRVVAKSAGKGERFARKNAPVETGTLRASIRSTLVDRGMAYTLGSDARDKKGHPYAFWTEFGKGAKPWLFRAYKREAKYLRGQIAKIIKVLGQRFKV